MKPYQDEPGPTIDFQSVFPELETRLKNANVLITGGASGIGKALATAFLEHDAYVTVADLDTPVLSTTREELSKLGGSRFQAIACNVTDWPSQVKLFESAVTLSPKGFIDVVIPCASPRGTQFSFDAPDLTSKSDRSDATVPPPPQVACIQVALIGLTYTCQLGIWYMARKKESLKCLLLVSSMTTYRGIAGNTDYTGAKYGARGVFKALRDASPNLNESDTDPAVRINLLCPGYIRTPLTEGSVEELLKMGLKFASLQDLTDGVLRMAADDSIHGKAVGVSSNGCFDLRDDMRGMNGMSAIAGQPWFEDVDKANRPRVGIW